MNLDKLKSLKENILNESSDKKQIKSMISKYVDLSDESNYTGMSYYLETDDPIQAISSLFSKDRKEEFIKIPSTAEVEEVIITK